MADKWVRQGSCNHCGYCCQFIGRFEMAVPEDMVGDRKFQEVRGFVGGKLVGDFYAPCPEHVNARCAIYDQRPITCQEFPTEPNQVKDTPCSYWFENEEGERIGGAGSPYGSA